MKKKAGMIVVMLTLTMFSYLMAAPGLKVTMTTVDPPGGSWGTNYEAAMWIRNAAGSFIKTFGFWGGDQNPNDFPIWYTNAGGVTTVDGTTGATPSAGATLNSTWNLTDINNAAVPKGAYSYRIELSNHHSSVAAYTDYFVSGTIQIDSASRVKNGVDSSVNNGSTYITNVIAEYTAPTNGTINTIPEKRTVAPFAFVTPAHFGRGTVTIRLFASNGRVVWQETYATSAGNSIIVSHRDIKQSTRFSGVGMLVADYGTEKVLRRFIQVY
jgi:hypothetical protein